MTTHATASVEALKPLPFVRDVAAGMPAHAMAGRLGVFQRAMLLWNDAHPYNAVHIARIPAALEAERLERLVRGYLESAGLTGLVVDDGRRRFHYLGGPARVAVKVLEGRDTAAILQSEIQAQLNTPFPIEEPFTPFRFFAMPGEGGFYLGLVYCHFISDADPVIALLTELARCYTGGRPQALAPDPYPNPRRHLLPVILKNAASAAVSFPRFVYKLSRSIKPRYALRTGQANAFAFFSVPRERFEAVSRAAHSWGVTLNDVFLAALVKAVGPQAEKRRKGNRGLVAVSSIASIRKDLRGQAAGKMAPFLGSFAVFHPVPNGLPLESVARNVSRQSAAAKKRKLYVRTIVDLAIARAFMHFASAEWREKFYRQNYPLWGGVSSFNLNWLAAADGAVADYFRAVSTGPACPLVFSITTYDNTLNIGVSYRTAVFSRDAVEAVIAAFRQCLSDPQNA